MEIHSLKINHIENPLGYLFKTITASYIVEGSNDEKTDGARIVVYEDEALNNVVFENQHRAKTQAPLFLEGSGMGSRGQVLGKQTGMVRNRAACRGVQGRVHFSGPGSGGTSSVC